VNATAYVFVDSSVQDYSALLTGVKPGYQTVLLENDRDGLAQITEVLATRQDVAEIHLVAHGSPGRLHLGNTTLDLANLESHAAALQQWRGALARCADILIYGCNVAQQIAQQKWQELLQPLHTLTGANIAAASQAVGQGHWELDRHIGEITATLAFTSDLQQSYAGTFAVAYLLSNNTIIPFDTDTPATLSPAITVTGLTTGDSLVGIDFRPQNGRLYGLGFNSTAGTAQFYAISLQTGVATALGTLGTFVNATGTTVPIAGAGFGVDFNPAVDRFRIVTSSGQNFRLNPNNGVAIDGDLGGAAGSAAGLNQDGAINGASTTVSATAYTNNSPNVSATTQYTLDADNDRLLIQNPPNAGTQAGSLNVTLGGARLDFTAVNGFDIPAGVNVSTSNAAATGRAFAALTVGGSTALYTIELSTGVATRVGTIGTGTTAVQGFAIQNQAPAGTPIVALTNANSLVRFNSSTPGTVATVAITGLTAGETLVGIDYRPTTGQLFGLGVNDAANTGSAYIIDPQTGAATVVGTAGQIAFVTAAGAAVDLPGSGYGFDFNPTVDRIRVVTSSGLNFRLNPITGGAVDGDLGGAAGSVAGVNTDGAVSGLPRNSTGVDATAYTNSFAGATTTTQYTLDSVSDTLLIQNPPNSGAQTLALAVNLNGSPLNFTAVNGFDIPSNVRVSTSNAVASGQALAALTVGSTTGLYGIDLATGAATFFGAIGSGATGLQGLAVGETAVGALTTTLTSNFASNGNAIATFATNSSQNLVQFSLTSRDSSFSNEFIAFAVDDDLGTINGIAPGASGYTNAAIARGRVIFSTIGRNPEGFDGSLSNTLDFGTSARFSTFLVQNGSLDGLRTGQTATSSILFASRTSVRVSDTSTSAFTYSFEDSPSGGDDDFNDAVLRVSTVSQSVARGAALQSQAELLDLRSLTGTVNVSFTVNREAAFDNFVGFYRVVNQNGGIDTNNDGTADLLPGAAGYTDAAVRNRVSSVNLTVANRQTATVTAALTGGGIFAPFIISNGTVAEVLAGQKLSQVYFPYLGANADRADHIRLLGSNVFGFEDLAGGGDRDFNDIVVRITV
jgi:3D (Asp-Asp-Asp) domain-containing protein